MRFPSQLNWTAQSLLDFWRASKKQDERPKKEKEDGLNTQQRELSTTRSMEPTSQFDDERVSGRGWGGLATSEQAREVIDRITRHAKENPESDERDVDFLNDAESLLIAVSDLRPFIQVKGLKNRLSGPVPFWLATWLVGNWGLAESLIQKASLNQLAYPIGINPTDSWSSSQRKFNGMLPSEHGHLLCAGLVSTQAKPKFEQALQTLVDHASIFQLVRAMGRPEEYWNAYASSNGCEERLLSCAEARGFVDQAALVKAIQRELKQPNVLGLKTENGEAQEWVAQTLLSAQDMGDKDLEIILGRALVFAGAKLPPCLERFGGWAWRFALGTDQPYLKKLAQQLTPDDLVPKKIDPIQGKKISFCSDKALACALSPAETACMLGSSKDHIQALCAMGARFEWGFIQGALEKNRLRWPSSPAVVLSRFESIELAGQLAPNPAKKVRKHTTL